jgi:hypothetical protein
VAFEIVIFPWAPKIQCLHKGDLGETVNAAMTLHIIIFVASLPRLTECRQE